MMMEVRHEHEWTVVCLGNEPIGASCECGETRGFELPPAAAIPRLGIGSEVYLDLHSSKGRKYVVRNVSLNMALGTESTAVLDLNDAMSQMERLIWNQRQEDEVPF